MNISSSTVANGGSVVLDLNHANYFTISASGTGTARWTASNAPAAGRVLTFVIEYAGGGQLTNAWFTGSKWSGGAVPTLTSNGTDVLAFSSDDAGASWRGVLLQRNSS